MYNNWVYNRLNESSIYDTAYSNADVVEKLGEVDVYDESTNSFKKMKPGELIKVVADALYRMQRDYPYLYQFIAKCKVMYIPVFPSQITDTMAVDEESNLWINFSFIYNECKMSSERAFGILFHEMFHIFFEHCFRFNKKYPREMFQGQDQGKNSPYGRANMKANLCMDYEVNASMVEDGIVTSDFFKVMNGMYKKEYTGMTWEEILDKHGDKEYKEWLSRNGMSLDDVEMKILEAIEKAGKVLMDPEADDDEKREARRQLQKDLDNILGKEARKGEKNLQETLEDLQNSKLGDISNLALDMDEVIDDLYKDPAGMSEEELDKTLNDMKRLADDMMDNADEIGSNFNKSAEEVQNDVKKAQEAFNDAMKQINEGNLSKDEKQDLIDKAKDALEDVIADENEKDKLQKKRDERDAKKAAERLEKFKKNHPIRKIIVVMKNFRELHNMKLGSGAGAMKRITGTMSLISDKTDEIIAEVINLLEPLTEKKFDEFKKSDLKELSKALDELKSSFLPDLVALIDDETILNKTPEDMQRLLDGVFEYVFNAFRRIFDSTIDDAAKASLMSLAAQKLRIIGKVLKTQKVWKVGEDFKEAYKEEMKRLMDIMKNDGEEGLFKELLNLDAIDIGALDENGWAILQKLREEGEVPDFINDDHTEEDSDYGMEETDYNDIEPFDGQLYFDTYIPSDEDEHTVVELSAISDVLSDNGDEYVPYGAKFEKDFPEYVIVETMESTWEVYIRTDFEKGKYICPTPEELEKKLLDKGYLKGEWMGE